MTGWAAAIADATADWRRRLADAVEHRNDEDPNGPIVCCLCGKRYRGLAGAAAHVDHAHTTGHGGAVPR